MTRTLIRVTWVAMVAVIAACAASDDPVIDVAADDAEMNAAISQARDSLAHFWSTFEAPNRGESDFALKVRIEDREAVEHFWVTDLRREGGRTYGLIGNEPNSVTTVRFGEEIEIPEGDVTDWLYMREGKMVGNFTLPPLFKQMPAAEVERLRSMMADP